MITHKLEGKVIDSAVMEFPEQLKLKTPIFVGSEETEVEVDVVLDSPGTEPDVIVELASADLEEAMIAEFERLADELQNSPVLSGDRGRVVLGSPDYSDWNYLD